MPKGPRKLHFSFEELGLTRFGGLSLFQPFCKSAGTLRYRSEWHSLLSSWVQRRISDLIKCNCNSFWQRLSRERLKLAVIKELHARVTSVREILYCYSETVWITIGISVFAVLPISMQIRNSCLDQSIGYVMRFWSTGQQWRDIYFLFGR